MKLLLDYEQEALDALRAFLKDPIGTNGSDDWRDRLMAARKATETVEDRMRMAHHTIDCLVDHGLKGKSS